VPFLRWQQTRFVRHEVKNGLLAGIELCDSLRNEVDAVRQAYLQSLQQAAANQSVEAEAKPKPAMKHISSATLLEESTLSADEDEDNVLSHISQFGDRVLDLDLLLHEVLETVLHEAMARDVIHEAYQPREERLDVVAVLSSSVSTKSGKSDRFPIQCEGDVPFLQMDSQLLRYIHRNAVSNAIKYGKSGGSVDTVLSFRAADSTLVMNVINERDDNDSLISNMSKEEYNAIVFSQGKSLHTNRQNSTSAISSGDGAWIMQKCAKTMGGSCSILFEREKTVFSFTAPVKPLKMSSHLTCAKDFVVPPDTIGIAIDDSKIQRKLMTRILSNTGVSSDNTFILGESPSEVKGLQALLFRLLKEQPESKILILVDENLDYGIGSVVEGEDIALSGSLIVQRILQGMSPEQESRILALVRSANDSTTDVACYIERTHGFFPKAPMQKDRVREIIAPLWAGKFMSS
jgi:signal transduction histidine kinase